MSPAGVTSLGLEQEDGLRFSTIFLYVAIHNNLIICEAFVSLRDIRGQASVYKCLPRLGPITLAPASHQVSQPSPEAMQKGSYGVSYILPHLWPLLNTSWSHIQTKLPDLDLFSNVSSQMPNTLV